MASVQRNRQANKRVFVPRTKERLQFIQQHTVGSDKLMVYEFVSKDCEVCKAMRRPFMDLSGKFHDKAGFFKLDVDRFQDLATNYGVEAYPTFVLVKLENGEKVVDKVVGVKEVTLENSIQRAIDEN
ncbi:hypothetical protein ACP70R_024284 [Stipagrostis hirtigluma subsp. patula]